MPHDVDGFVVPVPQKSLAAFHNRKHRDQVNKAVMADPRVANMEGQAMPFDGKRMFWGGFKTMVEL